MQQLRRLSFFDRTIVERTRYAQLPCDDSINPNTGGLSSGAEQPPSTQAQVHGAAAGPSRLSPLPSSSIVCAAGTDAYLWLGDDDGFLHTLDHDFQLRSLKSFDVCFVSMHAAVHASCIVCIGRDLQSEKPGKGPVGNGMGQLEDPRIRQGVLKYKCYSTTQVDGKGNPVLLREAGLFSKIPEQVVVCSDINMNFTMLAVGTESAGVCLFRGDLLREKTCRLRLMKENDEAVASVRFLASQSDSNTHYMLVCNTSSIACYAVTLKGEPKVCHTDSVSTASPHVVGALASLGTFVIHHGEGIFCVDPEQGNLWALPSEDRCHILTTHKSYIVSVTTEESSADAEPTHAGSAEILPEKFSPLQSKSSHQMLTIHLCYPELRLIAYSSPMRGVRHVVSAMDTLFVIARGGATENNVLFDVKEKSFDERLCILLRKRLFNWAAEVTIKDHQPQQVLQEVYRLHGDWLYSKNMPEKAVEMYIKTIGFLEPSAVIQKFLDAQELSHLAFYLLHLHLAGCAMQQHTLLFFKCTARLKDDALLASFLDDPRISKTCSLSVALNECRLNGDTALACAIASRHGYHDEHLSLLLETKEFSKAVDVLKQVDAPTACSLLLKHGSDLLRHSASDVLILLSQFISDYHTSVEVFIPLFVDDPDLLLLFLSLLAHGLPVARRLVREHETLCSDSKLQEAIEKARTAIVAFPSIFGCSPFSSLLELLLRRPTHLPAAQPLSHRLRKQVARVSPCLAACLRHNGWLAEQAFGESDHGMRTNEEQYRSTLLCTIFGFEEGMSLVCEKQHELQLPMAYFEASNDIPSLLRFCLKNGSKDPTLWTQTLNILASQSGTERQIREVLLHIERYRLLPPLTVLEILQQSQVVTLDAVKDFFLRASDELTDQLENAHALLQSDRAEVSRMAEEIDRFKSKAQVFESERCDFCFLPMELPSVHFRCGHSFHTYCLSSNTDTKTPALQTEGMAQASYCCAVCTPQFNAKRLLHSQREKEACNTDDFFKFLRGSTQGFDFILNCFGRGVLPTPLRTIGLLSKDVTGLDPLLRSYISTGADREGGILLENVVQTPAADVPSGPVGLSTSHGTSDHFPGPWPPLRSSTAAARCVIDPTGEN
ncbi:vacuolar protein sorting-associated protein 11 homolog [Cyclospora cayetanensis]|uniref:Vacuolar protein sorting-associated protein 11 homolog n=1 Tax=Cyclospora cayetanensis TaxID=88456 RepID=A0A6P6RWT3_9EIME|nr:vacuolar protein sorting-associated protein 11 homolog [Cyclospora cayetanensis]